jgi:hypothetical protein
LPGVAPWLPAYRAVEATGAAHALPTLTPTPVPTQTPVPTPAPPTPTRQPARPTATPVPPRASATVTVDRARGGLPTPQAPPTRVAGLPRSSV